MLSFEVVWAEDAGSAHTPGPGRVLVFWTIARALLRCSGVGFCAAGCVPSLARDPGVDGGESSERTPGATEQQSQGRKTDRQTDRPTARTQRTQCFYYRPCQPSFPAVQLRQRAEATFDVSSVEGPLAVHVSCIHGSRASSTWGVVCQLISTPSSSTAPSGIASPAPPARSALANLPPVFASSAQPPHHSANAQDQTLTPATRARLVPSSGDSFMALDPLAEKELLQADRAASIYTRRLAGASIDCPQRLFRTY